MFSRKKVLHPQKKNRGFCWHNLALLLLQGVWGQLECRTQSEQYCYNANGHNTMFCTLSIRHLRTGHTPLPFLSAQQQHIRR